MNISAPQKSVIVIGAGITGLAAAHRVVELDPSIRVTLLEARMRAGGVLETIELDGFLVEHSADNFITNVPWAVDLCRRVGLADELLATRVEQRGALVVHDGKLIRVPAGFTLLAPARLWPLLTTPLLSPWGKARLLAEFLIPRRRESGDESLASFTRRRLGRETFERIVQPLVGGIYTADPERLSLQATLPRFLEMERLHGGLIRGARKTATKQASGESGARYSLFSTLRGGLSTLVEALLAKLPPGTLQLNAPAEHLSRTGEGKWQVRYRASTGLSHTLDCDGVIVTTPAYRAADILRDVDQDLARELEQIEYAGTSIVSFGFRREQIGVKLDGFGFVVPAIERRRILAGSFSSLKFDGRAPDGSLLIRVFVGGACQSELLELPDEELRQVALAELRELLRIEGDPLLVDISRWKRAMPQYHLGHVERVAAIERNVARNPGLAVAGNAYHGVGIPHCIHGGELAAERIVELFRSQGN